MPVNTVAILSPGDMGHAVGQLLRAHELKVVTCLTGRSARTRALSEKAGIADVPDFNEMVAQSDIILSITTSEAAPGVCRQVADAAHATGARPLFAECNAISPQLVRQLEPVIVETGARFVDASIIGSSPKNGKGSPRFYASGTNAPELMQLRDFGLDVRNIGRETGQASGIKMCYAASTKGSTALYTHLLVAAQRLGLWEHLRAEYENSQPAMLRMMNNSVPKMPAKARRWVSEMQEIKATCEHLGLTPHLFEGVTDMYRFIGATPLGEETPETLDENRSLAETLRLLADELEKQPQ